MAHLPSRSAFDKRVTIYASSHFHCASLRGPMRPVLSWTITPLAAAALAGCAVGPDYVAPAMASPGRFMGQAAVAARPSASAPLESQAWWQGFNDPVLDRMIDRALGQNLDLVQAAALVTQAQ